MSMLIAGIAARKKLGMPPEWRPFHFAWIAGRLLVEGNVPAGTFKSGPRKGRPKWSRALPVQQAILSRAELDNAGAEWERETGLCAECEGRGVFLRERACKACGGSGKSKTPANGDGQ